MTNFSKHVALAVTFGSFMVLMVVLYFMIKAQYSPSEMVPLLVMVFVLAVPFVISIILSVKHRNDPEDTLIRARKLRLARTEGTIISGLPFVTTPFAEINLFREKSNF